MPEPAIGRIGYVLDGLGDGKTQQGGKERRCNNCRVWFPADASCPECGWRSTGFNLTIRRGQLDRHLFGYADTAAREPSHAPSISSDVNLPPRS